MLTAAPMSGQPSFTPKSDLVRVLSERGYVHQCTDLERLDARAAAGPITAYIGFDATASSLHVGSLVQIMLLRRLQQTGHHAIALMGGGTTRIGDPTGRDTGRRMLTDAEIAANIGGIQKAFAPFLRFEGEHAAVMVNNDGWLSAFGYVEFLRLYGTHFTVNRMLAFDSVRLRLEREEPMTFLEFNYMLMQSVDFLELFRRLGCTLQLGGSDQWGNIVSGADLVRRVDGGEAFGLTTPLITTASGAKMGKTADGAVWLSADLRSPYDYWQFWRNTEDADIGRFLRLFTDLPLDEVARLEALQGAEINAAKVVLANAATTMLHGAAAAQSAEGAAKAAFEQGGLSADLPTVEVAASRLAGLSNTALMVLAGFATSNGDARRQIAGGGFRIAGAKVSDPNAPVAIAGREAEIAKGKTRKRLLVTED